MWRAQPMKFVVSTQFLENYGAHSGKGTFAAGEHYWKMKGGTDYVVCGLDRIQDAVAFVAAKEMHNSIGAKEFPVEWKTYEEWVAQLPEDEPYREFLLEQAVELDVREILAK
jgi:hypothetical protein